MDKIEMSVQLTGQEWVYTLVILNVVVNGRRERIRKNWYLTTEKIPNLLAGRLVVLNLLQRGEAVEGLGKKISPARFIVDVSALDPVDYFWR